MGHVRSKAIHECGIILLLIGPCVMLIYSIADRNSFMGIDNWIEEIRKKQSNVPVVLVGNKCDLEAQREVEREEGEEKATSVGAVAFFEVSAKTNSNVEQAFKRLTAEALEHEKTHPDCYIFSSCNSTSVYNHRPEHTSYVVQSKICRYY